MIGPELWYWQHQHEIGGKVTWDGAQESSDLIYDMIKLRNKFLALHSKQKKEEKKQGWTIVKSLSVVWLKVKGSRSRAEVATFFLNVKVKSLLIIHDFCNANSSLALALVELAKGW